jgi:argininosuccinate lyase
MPLWSGRSSGEVNPQLDAFNRSIGFDSRMWREDIQGSLAHAAMLAECGIITREDAAAIRNGLHDISFDIESGTLEIDPTAEDIHTFIETELTRRIGGAGKRLHTARSRNDQVAADLRLYTMSELTKLQQMIIGLRHVLTKRSAEHRETVMPGYTHLQRAQPVTLALHLGAWLEMLKRDTTRLSGVIERTNECPLGSGALAGTTFPIDREFTAKALAFDSPCPNPMDAVGDRDFVLEALAALSILMVHLSRMAEEVILWCSSEFGFASLPDAFATGSSIMPQKKNPDLCELIRGKSGRVFGHLMGMLTVMKGLPLAYNKDMQEDKEALFGALDTVSACLAAFTPMMEAITFNPEKMRKACSEGFLNATDCADYLVHKGLPFREAYGIAGALVKVCVERGNTLEALEIDEFRKHSVLFDDDIYDALSLENCVKRRGMV